MFIFYFMCAYILVVFFVAISHGFLASYLKKYDQYIEKDKKYWEKIHERCRAKNDYSLKARELKKLKRPQMLNAFYDFYSERPREEFTKILSVNKRQFVKLGKNYRSTTVRAYFAHVLGAFKLEESALNSGLTDLMLEYVLDDSVYARENALKALYSFGNARKVCAAFCSLSKKEIYHSEKLLVDGLLTFSGDFENLSYWLMKYFKELMECYQISVINYLSYKREYEYNDILIDYMDQEEASVDVKCCILRILGKEKGERNKKVLMKSVEQYLNATEWEIASVAAGALGGYDKDKKVEELLCHALTSRNWYVRINSAKSLIRISASDDSIQKILSGEDKYAKDALMYAMNNK